MPTITISDAAGDYDYSVLDLNFKTFLDQGFNDFDYNSDKHGVQTVKLMQKDGDFLEMVGSFSLKGLTNHDRLSAVVSVDSLSVGHDKQTYYSITDLDLDKSDLKSDKTLAAYVDDHTYKIVGNASDNVLAGGLLGDQLSGNDGNDELYGNGGKDKLSGGDNNDILSGGNQDDSLDGGKGNDKLLGDDGNDKLVGGAGKDVLIGGEGNDTYYIDADDKIVEAKGKSGGSDTIVSADNVDLSKFSNVEDFVLIGSKNLKGFGDEGNNSLTGNDGDNTLWGHKGSDVMTGGDGADHFVFAKGDGEDTITDFNASGKNHDVLELDGFGKIKFSNIDFEKHGKDGLEIDFGHGDHLILDHVKLKDFDLHDFQF
jgi:Ca2+-binding RTX toxin-like protein